MGGEIFRNNLLILLYFVSIVENFIFLACIELKYVILGWFVRGFVMKFFYSFQLAGHYLDPIVENTIFLACAQLKHVI